MLRFAGVVRRSIVAVGVSLLLAGWVAPAHAQSRADKLRDEAVAADEAGNAGLALRKNEEACRLGNSSACNDAGLSYDVGSRVAENPAKALALYARACDLDVKQDEACEEAGDFLSKGVSGIAVDTARARSYYKRACDGTNAGYGCTAYAKMAWRGLAGPKDEVLARTYMLRACTGFISVNCSDAFYVVSEGVGGAKDLAKAREFAIRGCRQNSKPMTSPDKGYLCAAAGNMYAVGEGGAKDDKAAAQFFQTACGQGQPTGCYNLGSLLLDGTGVAKDPRSAVRMYQQACKLGSQEACALLKK